MKRTPMEHERDVVIALLIAAAICFAIAIVMSITGCGEAEPYDPGETRSEAAECDVDMTGWVHVAELRCDDPYAGWAIVCVDGEAFEMVAVGDVWHSCRLVRAEIEDRICIGGGE